MQNPKTLFKNRQARGMAIYALAAAVVVVVIVGGLAMTGHFQMSIGGNGGNNQNNLPPVQQYQGQQNTGTVSVDRKLSISLSDTFSSSMLPMQLDIYVNGAQQKYETVYTDASGAATTAKNYKSGASLDILAVNSSSKMWIQTSVPYMSSVDANGGASDPNPVSLAAFTIGTYATDTLKFGATGINDAGSYNSTTSGDTPVFKYTLDNTGADNTGLMDSFDPLTNEAQNWGTWVQVKLSGTGATDIVISGGDVAYQWTSGTDQYAWIRYDSQHLTKWLDGASTTYKTGYEGTDTHSFALDLSGYSGTAVTMQITAYAYADPTFANNHANNPGAAKVQIAEQTVTLTV